MQATRPPLRFLVVTVCLGTTGCASPGANSHATTPAPIPAGATSSDLFAKLRPGMPAPEVRALLGNPKAVKSHRPAEVKVEQWIYERPVWTTTTTEATRVREVPYFDPFTNTTRMIQEPDHQPLTITVIEIGTMLMVEDSATQWHVTRESRRDYN